MGKVVWYYFYSVVVCLVVSEKNQLVGLNSNVLNFFTVKLIIKSCIITA